ncbi:MAG: LysR family transcriptional regulator [Clostridia bacterium]|nr:LysR family transcriptional regulator [Clostridia bacterium]
MDLKEFEYVLTINEERSFSKAAKKLFISQPSLSQYINRLEGQLGVTLFDRNTIPLSLTFEGELYINSVKSIMNIVTNMRKNFDDISDLKIGRVNIGLTPSKANNPLPAILPVFKEIYPGIELIITERTSSELEDMLLRGQVDVCMLNLPIKSKGIEYEPIVKENIYIAAPPDYIPPSHVDTSAEFPQLSLNDIADEQFILLHPSQRLRQIADTVFTAENIKPKILLETASIETSLRLSAAGMGFSFVPEFSVKFAGLTKPPKYYTLPHDLNWTLVIAYREGAYRTKAVKAFAEIAKKVITE